jgi:hypothetical protein
VVRLPTASRIPLPALTLLVTGSPCVETLRHLNLFIPLIACTLTMPLTPPTPPHPTPTHIRCCSPAPTPPVPLGFLTPHRWPPPLAASPHPPSCASTHSAPPPTHTHTHTPPRCCTPAPTPPTLTAATLR